jgi:GxxExxY protein
LKKKNMASNQSVLQGMILAAARETHEELKQGYNEVHYQNLLLAKLKAIGLKAHKEVAFTMYSQEGHMLGTSRADIVVERLGVVDVEGEQVVQVAEGIIIEVKAGVKPCPKHYEQLLRYTRHYPLAYNGCLVYYGLYEFKLRWSDR